LDIKYILYFTLVKKILFSAQKHLNGPDGDIGAARIPWFLMLTAFARIELKKTAEKQTRSTQLKMPEKYCIYNRLIKQLKIWPKN
jgi:hypothetical protein